MNNEQRTTNKEQRTKNTEQQTPNNKQGTLNKEQPMSNIIKFENIESMILEIQGYKVLIDRDIAELYGVDTKRINEAVKNNPDKFPAGYIIELTKNEKNKLVENFDHFNILKHSVVLPKAFTEKGFYMLATILKGKKATETTIAIIEAFAKLRELTKNINILASGIDENAKKSLLQKSGEIISEILDNELKLSETETSIELNFAVLKFKHTIKKK